MSNRFDEQHEPATDEQTGWSKPRLIHISSSETAGGTRQKFKETLHIDRRKFTSINVYGVGPS